MCNFFEEMLRILPTFVLDLNVGSYEQELKRGVMKGSYDEPLPFSTKGCRQSYRPIITPYFNSPS